MQANILDLIEEINHSARDMYSCREKTKEHRSKRMPLQKKIQRYKRAWPACCSEADFLGWLDNWYLGAYREECNFCADCTTEFWVKMVKAGKCNRGVDVR